MSKRIVLIDPKIKQVMKIYENMQEVCDDLNIKKDSQLYRCLNNHNNHISNHIVKYEKYVSNENIEKWCDAVCWAPDGSRKCCHCKQWFNIEEFKNNNCEACYDKYAINYASSLNGFLRRLASRMRETSTKRKIKCDNEKGICELTYNDLLIIYNNQQGKCYYSNIEMQTKKLSNWQCSPERIDQTKGYTITNTKLICLEFNTGNVQWSLDKINKINLLRETMIDMEELINLVAFAKKNL